MLFRQKCCFNYHPTLILQIHPATQNLQKYKILQLLLTNCKCFQFSRHSRVMGTMEFQLLQKTKHTILCSYVILFLSIFIYFPFSAHAGTKTRILSNARTLQTKEVWRYIKKTTHESSTIHYWYEAPVLLAGLSVRWHLWTSWFVQWNCLKMRAQKNSPEPTTSLQ